MTKRDSAGAEFVEVSCAVCDGRDSRYERTVNGMVLERCRHCGFVFANPQYSPTELDRLYKVRDVKEMVDLYARIASPSIVQAYQETLELLEQRLPGRGRLLDFGCAAGYFFEQAAKRGWDAHGSDISPWTQLAATARGVDNLHVGSLEDLGFPAGHFDVVYSAQIFEHLQDPRLSLAEISRILRPGGLLYLDVPNYQTLSIVLGKDDFMLNTPPQHVNYFTPRSLRSMLESAGFGELRITTMGGLKWENLLGRPIRSEILDSYGLGRPLGDLEGGALRERRSLRTAASRAAKAVVMATFVKPVFYRWLKTGMLLVATARRSGNGVTSNNL